MTRIATDKPGFFEGLRRLDRAIRGGVLRAVQALGNFIGGAFVAPSGNSPGLAGTPPRMARWCSRRAPASSAVADAAVGRGGCPGRLGGPDARRARGPPRALQAAARQRVPTRSPTRSCSRPARSGARPSSRSRRCSIASISCPHAIAGDLKPGQVAPGEHLRYQPLGVVGVIGPFNFPLHLCHAHVDPGAARSATRW